MELSKLKKKTTKEAQSHPCYPDTAQELPQITDEIVRLNIEVEQKQAELKDKEALVKERVQDWFFTHYSGKSDIPSSIKVQGIDSAVLVQLTSRVSDIKIEPKNEDRIKQLKQLLGSHFSEQLLDNFKLEIDGNQIAEANREAFIHCLVVLLDVFGHGEVEDKVRKDFIENLDFSVQMNGYDNSNGEASEACQVVQSYKAKPSLHVERHALLSPKKNVALHKLMPYTVSVKKKGVKQ